MNTLPASNDRDAKHALNPHSCDGKNVRHGWANLGRRVAVAMWDFSWLVRRTNRESEYGNWGFVLDQLVDRGYNCIRLDPFPHLLSSFGELKQQDTYTVLPQADNFMWGNHAPVQVSVRTSLREFLTEVKKRPLGIALSSWFLDDVTHRKHRVRSPQDFADIWLQTLDLFAQEEAMDRILWVDLCNEFPMSIWAPGAYQQIFRTRRSHGLMPSALLLGFPWSRRAIGEINRYFDQSINVLKQHFPELKYTFSFQEFGARNLPRLDLSSFDLIEAHIWLSDDLWWSTISGHYKAAFGFFTEGVRKHAIRAGKIYPRYRDRCRTILEKRMSFWQALAQEKELPLVTSEGWVSTFYNDTHLHDERDEWEWIKDLTETAVQLAIEKGWSGVCTSNFCQPHFPRFWADRQWHRRLTDLITGRENSPSGSISC
ncbi:MAG: cellulase-like family protein [Pirellulaceae bacterium]